MGLQKNSLGSSPWMTCSCHSYTLLFEEQRSREQDECNWPESSTLKRAEYKLHTGPSHLPSPISTCHIVCAPLPLCMRELSEEANQMESASLGYWKVVCASWTLIALWPPAELAAVGLGDGGGIPREKRVRGQWQESWNHQRALLFEEGSKWREDGLAELCVLPRRAELWEGSGRSLVSNEKRRMRKQQAWERLETVLWAKVQFFVRINPFQ